MTQHSVQPRDVKDYGFLSFARNMWKNIGKSISKNVSSKYRQRLLDHAKQSATDALKADSKKQFNKQQKQLVIKLAINLLNTPQNNSKTVINKEDIYLQKKDSKLLIM